jgi:hypothetical protein
VPKRSFTKWILSLLTSILKFILPKRFKRYILLTTIYTKGIQENVFTDLDLQALNDKLCIAGNLKAMENISMVSGRLWSNLELNEVIRDGILCSLEGERVPIQDGYSIASKIVDIVPTWLTYKPDEMVADIVSLLRVEKVTMVVR